MQPYLRPIVLFHLKFLPGLSGLGPGGQDIVQGGGRYREVSPGTNRGKDPEPLKVKEVIHNGRRYILCVNHRQARKDRADREAIIESLKGQLKSGVKSFIGNKGYRKYLKSSKENAAIDEGKVEYEFRFDGKGC